MIHLHRIPPHSVTEEDVRWLVKITAADYDGESAAGIVQKALDRKVALWQILGDGEGLLVTAIKKGPQLWLDGVAGRRLVRNRFALRAALVDLARQNSCTSIAGRVSSPGMLRMLEAISWPIVGYTFRTELR